MFKQITISILIFLTVAITGFSQTVFINELHYDNTGGDVNEGFEIAGPAGTDLSCYRVTLYNGSTGASYATINLSGIIDDEGCNFGALWFAQAGIQNGAPDGIALYNTCTSTLIQFLSYEGAFTATNGDANGIGSTNIGVSEPAPPIGQSLQLTGTGTTYPDFTWNAPAASSEGSINTGQDFCTVCTPASEPATNASAYSFSNIGCNGVTISWTSPVANDSSLVVVKAGSDVTTDPIDGTVYTASSTFGSGSDIGASEFVVYDGSGTSVTVTGLTASTTYFFNVFEYNGESTCIDYRTSDEVSSSIATTACDTCPRLTAALINSCDNAPCTEGDNEMLFLNSGNYHVNTAAAGITMNYGSTSPAPNTYADSFTANPTQITNMNADPGCAGTYIDASTVNTIPPNSTFLILNETVCADAFDWSTMCSAVTGNIYVFFSSDATWTSSGQFSNNPTIRYYRTVIEGCAQDYSYDSSLPSGDGAIAFWDETAGAAISYDTNGCSLPATVLPITLTSFTGKKINLNTNLLEWSTSSEINNDFFTIEHSTNAIEFKAIGTVLGAGNSNTQLYYQLIDNNPKNGINYYRLKQTDFDGQFAYSKTIAINNNISDVDIYTSNNFLIIESSESEIKGSIQIFDALGRTIYSDKISVNKKINTGSFTNGIYIIKIGTPNNFIVRKMKF